ncbi:hypothetical protein IVA74_26995 [Bradyrhizobium sp. 132]|nr:hypothetical protein [Bradyrhizobium sp. 132]
MLNLKAEPAADLAHKPERRVTMSAIEERLIELGKNNHPKYRYANASDHGCESSFERCCASSSQRPQPEDGENSQGRHSHSMCRNQR